MESDEAPNHVQQLQQLAAQLHKDKAESDSVTWVPELIPIYVQKAVEYVLAPAGPESNSQQIFDVLSTDPTNSTPATTSGTAAAAPTAPAPALAMCHQHLQVTSSSKRPVDWVMTACLVPEGLSAAAAAQEAGGLATMEVVCRLLVLQDCQPAEVSAALTKALSKVKWQQYGLQYSDFFACDDNTGIVTLAVLPEAMMVPLSLIVCSRNIIEPSQYDPGTDAAAAATVDQNLTAETQDGSQANVTTAAARSSKRRRGGRSRAPPKPPTLSMRCEVPLWVGALEGALASLKAQLPEGYMRSRHEALLATALPPIAASLASIITHAANVELREESCSLLECEPAELGDTLLAQLQDLAAEALAQKSAATALQKQQRQGRQTQQPVDVAAAAAALLAAGTDCPEEEGVPADARASQKGQQDEQELDKDSMGREWEGGGTARWHYAQQQQQEEEEGGTAGCDYAQQQQWPGSVGGWEVGQGWKQLGDEQQQQQQQQQQLFGSAANWQQRAEDSEQQELWQSHTCGEQKQEHERGRWGLLGPAIKQQQEHMWQYGACQSSDKTAVHNAATAGAAAAGGGVQLGLDDALARPSAAAAAAAAAAAPGVVGLSRPPLPASRRRISGSIAAHLF